MCFDIDGDSFPLTVTTVGASSVLSLCIDGALRFGASSAKHSNNSNDPSCIAPNKAYKTFGLICVFVSSAKDCPVKFLAPSSQSCSAHLKITCRFLPDDKVAFAMKPCVSLTSAEVPFISFVAMPKLWITAEDRTLPTINEREKVAQNIP